MGWIVGVGIVGLFVLRVIFLVGDIDKGLGFGWESLFVILFWIDCVIGVLFCSVGRFVLLDISCRDLIVVLVVVGIEVDYGGCVIVICWRWELYFVLCFG